MPIDSPFDSLVGIRSPFGNRRASAPLIINYGWSVAQNLGTGGDYYVATDGDDSNPGTLLAPFATIQHAVDTANAAGGQKTIRVRAGVYRESVDAAGWYGASGAKNILAGYEAERPVITGAETVTGWTQCGAGDSAVIGSTLGVASSPVWKVTINEFRSLDRHVVEAGEILPISTDMASSMIRPLAYNNTGPYHSADSFGLNGSSHIETITDTSVIGTYTQAQLERMWVTYYREPNWTTITPVVGASGDTITIEAAHRQNGSATAYGLLNALPNLAQGSWGVVDNDDGTLTYYVYPNDVSNLTANMEIIRRSIGLTLSDADHVTVEGFEIRHVAGNGARVGQLGINADDHQQGITIRHVNVHDIFGTGVRAQLADDLTLEHVSIADTHGSYGISVTDFSDTRYGSHLKILYCDILRVEQSPIQLYSQHDALIAYSRLRDSGYGTHSNVFNNYIGSDRVMWWGMKVENCDAYATWQASTRTVIGMSFFDNLVQGGDAIRDQNGAGAGSEPVHPSDNWVVNNTLGGRNIEVGTNNPFGVHIHHVHNNIAGQIAVSGEGPDNIFEGGYNIWTVSDNRSNIFDELVAPGDVFADPANFDYSLSADSVAIGWGGKTLDDKLNEWETLYGVDLHRDVDGVPFSTLAFVGARAEAYRADTTAPILSAPVVTGTSKSSLEIGITTDTAEGGIWWVATTADTEPSAVQVAAGQDHTGAEAIAAGIIAATTAGTSLTASATGLTDDTTYYIYFSQEDRHGNRSALKTVSATTDIAPIVTPTTFTEQWSALSDGDADAAVRSNSDLAIYSKDNGTSMAAVADASAPNGVAVAITATATNRKVWSEPIETRLAEPWNVMRMEGVISGADGGFGETFVGSISGDYYGIVGRNDNNGNLACSLRVGASQSYGDLYSGTPSDYINFILEIEGAEARAKVWLVGEAEPANFTSRLHTSPIQINRIVIAYLNPGGTYFVRNYTVSLT